ncbi:MAG TPA: hypothetical protein VFX89_11445 [Gammaproteobacteria bacterium]|nr:hypothetical protein [Gammaproteobacteria bacterium]
MTAARCLALAAAAAAILSGCSHKDHALRCEPTDRYALAGSTPPVRVPDDLTPPDETDALQLPSTDVGRPASGEKPCLESPPTFTPAGRARSPQPAAPPPAPPPAPPAGGDREIGN